MKKRGSALVYVIAFTSVLMVLGTVVSSAVISTTKNNQEHSEIIDLELAAKSGLNMFREELLLQIRTADTASNLPNNVDEIDSGISEFEGINISKKIIKEEIKSGPDISGYRYTIYSKAIDSVKNINKEVSQIINVNISGDSGGIGGIEIAPESILNIKGNVEWVWSNLDFLKRISYSGEIVATGQDKNEIDRYINNNNIVSSDVLGELYFKVNENNIRSELGINVPDKKVKSFNGLSNIKWNDIDKNNIKDKKYYIDEDVKYQNTINIDNSTLIINGKMLSEGSITLNLNNSNLIINGDFDISHSLTIKLDNSSFVKINGDIIGRTGNGEIELSGGSIFNVYGRIINSSNPLIIKLYDNSVIDIDKMIEANTINITSDTSKFICRDEGISSPRNSVTISGVKSDIFVNGPIIANSVEVSLGNNSKINTKQIEAPGHFIKVVLDKSEALIQGDVLANDLDLSCNYGTVVVRGTSDINKIDYKLTNSISITEGDVDVHTFDIRLTNSIGYILNSYLNLNAATIRNIIRINNVEKGTFYMMGNLKTNQIQVSGNPSDVTPDDEILYEVNKLLAN